MIALSSDGQASIISGLGESSLVRPAVQSNGLQANEYVLQYTVALDVYFRSILPLRLVPFNLSKASPLSTLHSTILHGSLIARGTRLP